jgi:hypothetical protein
MNYQSTTVRSRLANSWDSLKASALLSLVAVTLISCGGSADETIASTRTNTPLSLTNFTGLKGYTVGSTQVYSVTVKDPDGISSVSVKLDGENVPVITTGDVYSITLPTSITVGTHSVVFTARGKSVDGTLEVPISEGVNFTVFQSNTPLSISGVQGFAAYTVSTAQTYFTDVVDPNGISIVTASLNGQSIAVSVLANRYSVVVPATTPAGSNTLRFEAIGKQPDSSNEAPQSAQLAFIIYANNTNLVAGNIAGLANYTVGGSQTYSLSPVDPDGITSVTATLDGASVTLSESGNTYSFITPTNLSVGNHAVSFTATGRQPNGTAETAVVVSQSFTILTSNTPLTLGTIIGPASYTVGAAQVYTSNVTDPDGIVSVSATLDGAPLTAVPSNGVYSVTLPTSVTTGAHTIQFSAIGRRPDGSSETAVIVSRQIQVLATNTGLSLSSISGLASYVTGATPSYTANIVDPDGINSVSVTLDGSPIGISNNGSTYSVIMPSTLSLGQHTLVFRAQGTQPDTTLETLQTTSFTLTVLAANTALSIGTITGPATIPLNSIGTYSVLVTDPDGLVVTATIDNVAANVTNNGSTYSVQTPPYSTGGSHVVTFVATGQIPGGGNEAAQSATRGFTAQTANTPIAVGAINGPATTAFGQAPVYSFTVTDPDGIVSVNATLNGQTITTFAPAFGSTYSVQLPANTPAGTYSLVVTAVGNIPGASTETAQTQPFNISVINTNTLLTMGSVTVQFVGNFVQWSCIIDEPDGNANVTASASGQNQIVIKSGNVYSFSTSPTASVTNVTFTAIGVEPNGSPEPQQTRTYIAPPLN